MNSREASRKSRQSRNTVFRNTILSLSRSGERVRVYPENKVDAAGLQPNTRDFGSEMRYIFSSWMS